MTEHSLNRPPESWAEVRARGEVLRYRRSGAGPSVVVVAGPGRRLPWPEVEALLAEHCRVVSPRLSEGDSGGLVTQVSCFLEGLGVARVSLLVVDPALAPAILQLAAADTDIVARVAIITDESRPAPASYDSGDLVVTSPVPVLTLSATESARDAAARLLRFVGVPGQP